MNSLQRLISQMDLDEVKVLNGLQAEAGIVSDNCLVAADVAGVNCFKACEWVLANVERVKR